MIGLGQLWSLCLSWQTRWHGTQGGHGKKTEQQETLGSQPSPPRPKWSWREGEPAWQPSRSAQGQGDIGLGGSPCHPDTETQAQGARVSQDCRGLCALEAEPGWKHSGQLAHGKGQAQQAEVDLSPEVSAGAKALRHSLEPGVMPGTTWMIWSQS